MTPDQNPTLPETHSKKEQPSYAGWKYQILASTWLALEFILLKGAATVGIEPETDEDFSATVEVSEEERTSALVETERYQFQIKLRNNVLWSMSGFESLFPEKIKKGPRGPNPRKRPLKYLSENPDSRYILVTNTGIERDLKDFKIVEIGENSRASGFDKLKADPEILRRIGIIEGKSTELLEIKIATLLREVCYVPCQKSQDCIEGLKSCVEERLKGNVPRILPRSEIEKIVILHNGRFVPRRPPVLPSNYAAIKDHLSKKHAIVLIGPPGTGKTEITNELADRLRFGDPPAEMEIVNLRQPIQQVRESLRTHGSTVYYVEDPWGQGPPDPGSDLITTELPKLLALARPGKTFLVTSTVAAFQEATRAAPELFKKWIQELGPDDYSGSAREEIFKRMIEGWPTENRDSALGLMPAVMPNLETPFAIFIFCNQLDEDLKVGRVTESKAIELAKESNVGAVATNLIRRIMVGGENDIKSAVVLWALLTIGRNIVNEENVRLARRHLKEGGMVGAPDIERFFNYLASSWLRERSSGYLATPTVKKGLSKVMDDCPGLFDDTMEALARGWALAGNFDSIHLCVREVKSTRFVPEDISFGLDAHLVAIAINSEGYSFGYCLDEVASFTTHRSLPGYLARALTARKGPEKEHWWPLNGPKWDLPTLAPKEITRIAQNRECLALAESFAIYYLPHHCSYWNDQDTYEPSQITEFLKQFTWPVDEWFSAAFQDSLQDPHESTQYLLRCVLELVPERIDSLITACVAAVRAADHESTDTDRESRRKDQQGEIDASYHQDDDSYWDSYHNACGALKVAVLDKYKKDGFEWMAAHPDIDRLLFPWMEIAKEDSEIEERYILVDRCTALGCPGVAAEIVARSEGADFHSWAVDQLASVRDKVPSYLGSVLLKFAHTEEFVRLIDVGMGESSRGLLALLALILAGEMHPAGRHDTEPLPDSEDWFRNYPAVESRFSAAERHSIVECSLTEKGRQTAQPEECDEDLLHALAEAWPPCYGVLAAKVLWSLGHPDAAAGLDRFLGSPDATVRRHAWSICPSREQLINEGLNDADCFCRIECLKRLVPDASATEWASLLLLRDDSSAFVKEELASQIGEAGFEEANHVLIGLLGDRRDYGTHQDPDDSEIFDVAKTAASSLVKLTASVEPHLAEVRDFLERCVLASPDARIHALLFELLSHHPSTENMSFCCRYLNSIWLASDWKEKRGHHLVEKCVDVVSIMLANDSNLLSVFDLSKVSVAATWQDANGWMVAPITTAIGLGASSVSFNLSEIVESEHFDECRARLLVALSPSLREELPGYLNTHLSNADTFLDFLKWTSEEADRDFERFVGGHQSFKDWLKALANGNSMDKRLHWAMWRWISSFTGKYNLVPFPSSGT